MFVDGVAVHHDSDRLPDDLTGLQRDAGCRPRAPSQIITDVWTARRVAACRVWSSNADGRVEYRLKPPTRPDSRKISTPICDMHPASDAGGANRGHLISVRMSSTTTDV
jgi:hypothetical protein